MRGRFQQFSCVRKDFESLAHVLRFVGFWVGFLDFVVLEAEQIEPFELPGVFRCQFGKLRFDLLNCVKEVANPGGSSGRFGKGIDQIKLARIVQ